MNFTLVSGEFTQTDALHLLTQLVEVKIKFHESKIEKSHQEEDIKMREQRIKQLQHDLQHAREAIMAKGSSCALQGQLHIS
jgi:cob(I)alamin adenosyltransferase